MSISPTLSPTNPYGIQAVIDDRGNLRIEADEQGRQSIADEAQGGYYTAEALVIDALRDQGLVDFVQPEWIGVLTDAPILADAIDYPDEGDPRLYPESKVWWFPNYMVIDPWEELAEKGFVVFDAAPIEQEAAAAATEAGM